MITLASLGKQLRRAGFFALISYGLFYFAYKFYLPADGGQDFYQYYPTYLHPLDWRAGTAPFVDRQVSAVLTNLVYRFGPYYRTEIAFRDPRFDQHVFFAAILVNYLAVVASACVAAAAVERLAPRAPSSASLFAGALCFLGFFIQGSAISPTTDGLAWLLMAVGFLGLASRSLITLGVVLALSVVERETVALVLAVFAVVGMALRPPERRFFAILLGLSAAALAAYLALRLWGPSVSHVEQTDPAAIGRKILHWRRFVNKEVLTQGFLSQNLLILLAAILAWRRWISPRTGSLVPEDAGYLVAALFAAAAALVVVSLATLSAPENVGRIVAMLTPMAAALLALMLTSSRASGEGEPADAPVS